MKVEETQFTAGETGETVRDLIRDLERISRVLEPTHLKSRITALRCVLAFGAVLGIGWGAAAIWGLDNWLFLFIGLLPFILIGIVLLADTLSGGSWKMLNVTFFLLFMLIGVAFISAIGARLSNTPGLLWASGIGYLVPLIVMFGSVYGLIENLVHTLRWPKVRPRAIQRVQQSKVIDEGTRAKALDLLSARSPDSAALIRMLREKIPAA